MPIERKHTHSKANANFNYWLNDAINQDEYEEMIFFYHKDLPKAFGMGSSTQISDGGANIIQHIEYLPYGETFFERRSYWNTPYKFNAKELDEETGMYYYGARYYTPEVSIWLSVDPLADKYPSMSAFIYCAGNPVKFIDPDGNRIILKGNRKQKKAYVNMLNENTTNVTASVSLFGVLRIKVNDPNQQNSAFDNSLLNSYNNKDNKVKMNLNDNNQFKNDIFYLPRGYDVLKNETEIDADLNSLAKANNTDQMLFQILTQKNIDVSEGVGKTETRANSAAIYNEHNNSNVISLEINYSKTDIKGKINLRDRSDKPLYGTSDSKILRSYSFDRKPTFPNELNKIEIDN